MGAKQSATYEQEKEKPSTDNGNTATLYYFAGRGLADQVRWLLAASNIAFTQKVINERSKFLKMSERQLPFGQLPLLQIDGLELVQSQAIIRYLAKREKLEGKTSSDIAKCDMIAETVRDLISLAVRVPFLKTKANDEYSSLIATMRDKWSSVGSRFEAILINNGKTYLVGSSMTYADILVVHVLTWFVEECGPSIVGNMPNLVDLQYNVLSLPGLTTFLKSDLYYPVGDVEYVEQVSVVLGRKI